MEIRLSALQGNMSGVDREVLCMHMYQSLAGSRDSQLFLEENEGASGFTASLLSICVDVSLPINIRLFSSIVIKNAISRR